MKSETSKLNYFLSIKTIPSHLVSEPHSSLISDGSVVIQDLGRGGRSGIVLKQGKRKSLVRFTDNTQMWIKTKKLMLVTDERTRHRVLKELKINEK